MGRRSVGADRRRRRDRSFGSDRVTPAASAHAECPDDQRRACAAGTVTTEFRPALASSSQRDPEHVKAESPRAAAKPAVSKEPVTKTTGESARVPATKVTEPATKSPPKAAAIELAPKPAPENDPAVTITGCLELESESFWLKDTSGTGAPAARSWRSAFLRKRPARIELVDATNALPLPTYVGQRVAATGLLVNRGMQTRSLYRVAGSCN